MPEEIRYPDEETPLLNERDDAKRSPQRPTVTPLPKAQITILLVLQLAEPITSQCIYPFINQLISELPITGGDKAKVGYYAGIIESLFFAAEALTVLQWSRLSDRIGRKPVLLSGLLGLTVSMIFFGLSKTFWSLVISRCLAGALNGNIGVMKSMMGDLTDSTNMAKAFAWMPVVWSTGATMGPLLGGMLSRPQERYPNVFKGRIWAEYPYFLPCLVAAGFSTVACLIVLLFLKETVKRHYSYETPQTPPLPGATSIQTDPGAPTPSGPPPSSLPLRALLTPPVILSIANYALLAFLDISFFALLPLFHSTPVPLGGLGFSPPTIGLLLGAFGVVNACVQGLTFARVIERWGPKKVFVAGLGTFVPIFAAFPGANALARRGAWKGVWAVLAGQMGLCVLMDMCFGCVMIFVTSAAPNRRSLGATNGLAQTTVSIIRAFGPAFATSLFAFSVERDLLGGYFVYLVLGTSTWAALVVAGKLPGKVWVRVGEGEGRAGVGE